VSSPLGLVCFSVLKLVPLAPPLRRASRVDGIQVPAHRQSRPRCGPLPACGPTDGVLRLSVPLLRPALSPPPRAAHVITSPGSLITSTRWTPDGAVDQSFAFAVMLISRLFSHCLYKRMGSFFQGPRLETAAYRRQAVRAVKKANACSCFMLRCSIISLVGSPVELLASSVSFAEFCGFSSRSQRL
jgi:hypothetical protein